MNRMNDILDEAQEFVLSESGDTLKAVELIEDMSTEIENLREKLNDANYRLEAAGVTVGA